MNVVPLNLLIVVNPNASRAVEAFPRITEWFAERDQLVVVTAKRSSRPCCAGKAQPRTGLSSVAVTGRFRRLPVLLELKKPLAVLPLGTANDFARTLGLTLDPFEAAKIALEGREHLIDVGLANGTPFLNVASIGLASRVVTEQSKELKRRWRVFAYAIGLLRVARDMQPFFVDIEIDDRPRWSAPVYQVSVGNGRYHGGGLIVAENAAIDDGKLDLYVVYPGTFWADEEPRGARAPLGTAGETHHRPAAGGQCRRQARRRDPRRVYAAT